MCRCGSVPPGTRAGGQVGASGLRALREAKAARERMLAASAKAGRVVEESKPKGPDIQVATGTLWCGPRGMSLGSTYGRPHAQATWLRPVLGGLALEGSRGPGVWGPHGQYWVQAGVWPLEPTRKGKEAP